MEIFLYFLISSIVLVFSGRFFLQRLGINLNKQEFSFSEQGLYGLIFFSFLSLFLNFFFKIDQLLSTIVLIFPIIQFILEFKKLDKIFFKNFLKHAVLITLISVIFISYDNVFRPDAGIYHLPYIKIINDFKIFSGIVTLNPVFGATSILQYTSAIFNNFIFKDIGITIPLAILTIYLIEYFVSQFFKKNSNNSFYKLFLFLIITYIFLEMNRYSEYGNDNPAHIVLFYFLTLIFKEDFKISSNSNFKVLTLVSLFIFLNKIFFILILLFPITIWFKNKFYLSKKFLPIFSIIFFSLWIIKNILISGCAIYPVSFTCSEKLDWYSNNPKFVIAANNLSQFSELHAKNWSAIVDDNKFINYQDKKNEKNKYLKNFNWLNSDKLSKEAKFGFFKIFNNYIFLIFIISLIFFIKNDYKKTTTRKLSFEKKIILAISILSSLIALYKFPLGRYATSYFVVIIFFIFYFIFNKKLGLLQNKKNIKLLSILLIVTGFIFTLKNVTRVVSNINTDYYQAPWPRIYENKNKVKNLNSNFNKPQEFNYELKNDILKIFYINKLNYWTSDRSVTCMYNSSPCAQTGNNFNNFEVEKTSNNYFIIKLNKN
jgi:hypothetical protein